MSVIPEWCKKFNISGTSSINVCNSAPGVSPANSYIEGSKTKNGVNPKVSVTITGKIAFACRFFKCPPDGGSVTIERALVLSIPSCLKWLAKAANLKVSGTIGLFVGMKKGSVFGLVQGDILVYGGVNIEIGSFFSAAVELMGGITIYDFDLSTLTFDRISISIKFVASVVLGPFTTLITIKLLEDGKWMTKVNFQFVDFEKFLANLKAAFEALVKHIGRALEDAYHKVADALAKVWGFLKGWR